MRVHHPGNDGREAMEALRRHRQEIIRMMTECRPFGPDYMILDSVRNAFDRAADRLTGEPDFFALKPPRS